MLRRVFDILVDCMPSQILWKEHGYINVEWMGNCTYLFHFADLCYLCCYFFDFLTVSPKCYVDSWDFSVQFSYRLSSCSGLWSESIFEFISHIHFFGCLVGCWEQQELPFNLIFHVWMCSWWIFQMAVSFSHLYCLPFIFDVPQLTQWGGCVCSFTCFISESSCWSSVNFYAWIVYWK